MPLVLIQTTLPGNKSKPFRITEVLGRVAESVHEALEIAAIHIGGEREAIEQLLTARWHDAGGYWLVSYEPAPEFEERPALLM